MTDKEILLKLEEIVFEEIIAPNCATCSDAISGHPNKCDNGINCMSKLLNGEFINYKKIKDLDQNKALKTENERLRKASKEGLFSLTKAHEVARMVDIRLNPENSVNKEDFLNHISEGYLFNQSTISLLDDAKAALQSVQGKTCKGCLRFKSDNPLESCTSKDEDNSVL